MGEARKACVSVPILYDIYLVGSKIVMEFVDGSAPKTILDRGGKDATSTCGKSGEAIARLHRADIVHGDLTTSNMILRDGRLVLIDRKSTRLNSSHERLYLMPSSARKKKEQITIKETKEEPKEWIYQTVTA